MTPAGFRTLQHPKSGRTIAIATNRSNSPFTPAPLIFPQTIIKQGYVTIPRKPRTSWAPSANSTTLDFPPTSPTSITSSEIADPIYDNLGVRTTASGHSTLELNKLKGSVKYNMKDRPLPATPNNNNTNITIDDVAPTYSLFHDVLPDLNGDHTTETDPLYTKSNNVQIVNGEKGLTKIPPRPPPKPKKKVTVNSAGQTSTNKLFDDEGEDGTEV